MATHSSTLAWKIPWTEEPGGLQSMGSLESVTTSLSLSRLGEGNGNPLQCSCLENPRDGEVWWAAVYGVEKSRTRLKQLSSSSSMILKPGWDDSNQFQDNGFSGEEGREMEWKRIHIMNMNMNIHHYQICTILFL